MYPSLAVICTAASFENIPSEVELGGQIFTATNLVNKPAF